MKLAVILHTIEDVKHCLKHGLHNDSKLFSANVNVVYYLKYHCEIECEDLCLYITTEEFLDIRKSAFRISQLLFNELDQKIAVDLNQYLDLNIRYFEPLYSFVGTRQLYFYILFIRCFARMREQHHPKEFVIYEGVVGPFNSSLKKFLLHIFPDISLLWVHRNNKSEKIKPIFQGVALDEIADLVMKKDENVLDFDIAKRNVILFEQLNRMRFFPEKIDGINIYTFDATGGQIDNALHYELSHNALPMSNSLLSIQSVKEELKKPMLLSYEAIKNDFCHNIIQYLRILNFYRMLHEKKNIQTAYWETPLYQGAGALLLEYLMKNNVTRVVGAQSVSTFWVGKLILPYANELIFSRCHYYLTQGVTKEEVGALYPAALKDVTVIPPEVAAEAEIQSNKLSIKGKSVDIAIYLSPASSFLQTGHIYNHLSRQEMLLAFLAAKTDQHIHIIAHEGLTDTNCSMFSMIRGVKHFSLITNTCLEEYLTQYSPELLLIDAFVPSWEKILQEDISIILIQDDMAPFDDNILSVLQKRVYPAKGIIEVQKFLQRYFAGMLQKKKDKAYSSKYSNQTGLKERVLEFMSCK